MFSLILLIISYDGKEIGSFNHYKLVQHRHSAYVVTHDNPISPYIQGGFIAGYTQAGTGAKVQPFAAGVVVQDVNDVPVNNMGNENASVWLACCYLISY